MGHAFICEYCECYHTVTDGCDEYDQNRANRIMVNNETQKENKMAHKLYLSINDHRNNQKDVLERLYTYIRKMQPHLSHETDAETLCVDSAKEIAELRAENDRLEDEAYTARQAARGENALRLEAERMNGQTIATLRDGLEHHRLAHDDAKAAWEKECSERDIAEEKLEAAERDRDDARKALLNVLKWVPHILQSGWAPWVQEQIDVARDLE
jgi:hypothetical protein